MTRDDITAVERMPMYDAHDELVGCPTVAHVAAVGTHQVVPYVRTHVASGTATIDKIAVRSRAHAEHLIRRWNAANAGWTYQLQA